MWSKMSEKLFDGPAISLKDMLDARSRRVAVQKELLSEEKDTVLICATLNIPGPVKYSASLAEVFQTMVEAVEKTMGETVQTTYISPKEHTGPVCYFLTSLPEKEVKKKMVMIEETHPFGRLADLDVLCLADDQPRPVSRKELGIPARSCFLCTQEAKLCGRARKHTVQEMQQAIHRIIEKGRRELDDKKDSTDGNSLARWAAEPDRYADAH